MLSVRVGVKGKYGWGPVGCILVFVWIAMSLQASLISKPRLPINNCDEPHPNHKSVSTWADFLIYSWWHVEAAPGGREGRGITCDILSYTEVHWASMYTFIGETVITSQRLMDLLGSCLVHCRPKVCAEFWFVSNYFCYFNIGFEWSWGWQLWTEYAGCDIGVS